MNARNAGNVEGLTTTAGKFGEWMRLHGRTIRIVQWLIVLLYGVLVIVPAFLPLPTDTAHLWSHLTLIAQCAFWGVWWPFVLLSMVFAGRIWCGVLCPEGTLTEFSSRHGRGGTIPRWVRWSGWPLTGFVLTTVYGQLISVYQYPKAVLLILGGSTVGAIVVGYLYGKNKRVWCRYLCPVNGVFGLLAKLSPLHYKVDEAAWRASYGQVDRVAPVNCAPLVPLRHMKGAADCHMCGRCSAHRGAIVLATRPLASEVRDIGEARDSARETVLLLFGLCGVAVGAFHWTVSPWFVWLKQTLAMWLVDHDVLWPLETDLPWWVVTHYPQNNDVFSWLDGATIFLYIFLTAAVLACMLFGLIYLSGTILAKGRRACVHHMTRSLTPVAGCGVFIGLSATTVSLLRGEHWQLAWVNDVRAGLLVAASIWSGWIAWQITRQYQRALIIRCWSMVPVCIAIVLINCNWLLMFVVW